MRYFFPLLCCFASLFSDEIEDDLLPLSTPYHLANDHLIGGKVSPLSGQLGLRVTDLVVKGAQPLYLERIYLPPYMPCFDLNKREEKIYLHRHLAASYKGWELLPHLKLQVIPSRGQKIEPQIRLTEPSGSTLEFTLVDGKTTIRGPHFAMSNTMGDAPHGSYDLRNIKVEIAGEQVIVYSPDGTTRYYSAKIAGRERINPQKLKLLLHRRPYICFLEKEVLPNGKILKYHYQNQNLSRIESLDPQERHVYASIQVEGSTFTTSSGLSSHYNYEIRQTKIKKETLFAPPILKSVSSPFYQHEEMVYCPCFLLNSYKGKDAVFESFHRPCEIPNAGHHYRIHTLRFPGGPNDKMETVYEINYDPPLAGTKEGATTVHNCDGTKTIYYFNSNLLPKVFSYFDREGVLRKEKHFFWYDNHWLKAIEVHDSRAHTILYKKIYEYDSLGNPIVETFYGDEPYSIFRQYSQDGKNLLLREETEEGKVTTYEYLPHTNLLTKKQVLDTIELYTYDDCNNLIRKIVTDGQNTKIVTDYTLRTTQPFLHMPEWVEEKYGNEEKLLKRTHLLYNNHGNVVQEEVYDADGQLAYTLYKEYNERGSLLSETNALGQKATYVYDDRGRCISNTNFSQRLNTTFSYDLKGRLRKEDKGGYISSFVYDANDRLIQKTDYLNNTIGYSYDPIVDKVVRTDFPGSIITSSRYDALGCKVAYTDANGNTTTTGYNAYGSPKEIVYPDGSKELFTYYKNGKLASHTDADGLTITHTYDLQGRILSKKSNFAEESFTYDSFNLLFSTDREGNVTKYFYDGLNRKIREETMGRVTEFAYDALGELSTICKNNSLLITYKRDLAGQILEETKTDRDGNLLYKISHTYDADGNQNTVTRYIDGNEAVDSWQYDPFGRLVEHRDALHCVTTKGYDESGPLRITTTDPKSVATTEIFDPFNRLVQKQIGDHSPKIFTYDPQGNLISQTQDNQIIRYTYTNTNRVATLVRADKRTTSYTYTPSGKLSTKTLPDGTTLAYEYHSLGFLTSLTSSDGQTHHTFQYDRLGRLVKATDEVLNLTIQRKLDPFGNVLEEMFPAGQKVEKTYDSFDRPLSVNGVLYSYDPLYLRKVEWDNYSHTYDQYDLDGNLLKETTLTGDPIIHTTDSRGQKSSISHPDFTQKCFYDSAGNLIQCNEHSYDYDDLSQLISEDSNHYSYDSLYNRLSKNNQKAAFNDLNEIVSPVHSFDLNGNLIVNGNWHFSYDPLGRLVQAQDGNQNIIFTYDPLGRRLSKNKETYLYDGQNEIGAYGKNSRILGLGDETIAIELYGKTYAPITDVQKNIRHLANTDVSYNFTAFGEELNPTDLSNPWRFASKRFDPELGLIYFGKRYYDPILARWLTPDPAGFIDSTNLYQFVLNNPFRYTDPHGEFVFVIPLVLSYKIIAAALLAYAATEAIRMGGDKLSDSINYRLNLKGETLAKDVFGPVYTGYRTLYAQGTEEEVEEKKKHNTNPFDGPVDEEVLVGDDKGNIIPVPTGYQLGGSKDGKCVQVKDNKGRETGIRMDGKGHSSHSDPRAKQPHAHLPEVTNDDGTTWLPIH